MLDRIISFVYRNDYQALKKLIESGTAINATVDRYGRTALMHAVLGRNVDTDMVKFLIELGADVNVCEKEKWTALHFAARDLKLEIVEVLLTHGALIDPEDSIGNTPLWRCVMSTFPGNQIDVINVLLENGANPNKKNKYGNSAKDIVILTAETELVKLFDEKANEK